MSDLPNRFLVGVNERGWLLIDILGRELNDVRMFPAVSAYHMRRAVQVALEMAAQQAYADAGRFDTPDRIRAIRVEDVLKKLEKDYD